MSPKPMQALHTYQWVLFLAGALLLGACNGGDEPGEPTPPDNPPPDNPDNPDNSDLATSVRSQVKFKGSDRLRNDFAQTLALDPAQLCNELGQYSCTETVHRVPLGGTSAYDLGLFKPLPFSSLTSPIAVERLSLSTCVARVDLDLASDEPVIFAGLDIDANGALADVDAASVQTAIDTLYKRALLRPVRDTELAHLRQLYRDIAATDVEQPAREWAVLSCFAVMTTMEQLFY